MTPNNNLSVLPFYLNIDWQNAKKSYAYGDVYPLATPLYTLLPFQIIRPARTAGTLRVHLLNEKGQFMQDITINCYETGLRTERFTALGYDVIVYPGVFQLQSNLPIGRYCIRFTDEVETWYSDIFTWTNDVSGLMRIQWWDIETLHFDAGAIVYDGIFKNTLYICAQLGKPEYPFEEEGETRDGYFFPEKQVSYKTYKTIFLAPEYLCDVMRLIRLSDFVTVDVGGQHYDCDTFLITPKWQTQGNLASVEIEFTTDTVVKKIGRGYVSSRNGDFNNDFNNDFDIKD